ncbi:MULTISPECIES: YcnI family copper-binding membrane protein [Prauserella salsuginis group]|uniref:YcnI family protein n=1 Tax=Prauserella salsuginis TaxID=387889 RepID=A0ABW6FYD0_9PSEU|nr:MULTISPECIES: YcnI family protein [Prauserella salsuginis group]MCR3720330.1 Uncharacterized protein YcnI [Prauserella flava]MCR3733961.1 Uncharacterized protein YcnI [Prauserella salsuginis]
MSTSRPTGHGSPSGSRLRARGATLTTALGAALAAGAVLGAPAASAHVTANVYGDAPEKGGYGAITLRVPNEEEQAGTTKLEMTVPAEYKITSARTQPVPGWTSEVTTNGSDVVTKVTWTADGEGIPAGLDSYQEFGVQLGALPDNIGELMLPTKQTYSDGTVSDWNEPQEGDAEPESPAPVVPLAESSGGHGAHSAAGEGENASGETGSGDHAHAPEGGTDDTARWLGGAGLLVGALGVGVGAGATLRARKNGKVDS